MNNDLYAQVAAITQTANRTDTRAENPPVPDARVRGYGIENGVNAALYIPIQTFNGVYDTATALRRGTLFSSLDLPFYGTTEGGLCRGSV